MMTMKKNTLMFIALGWLPLSCKFRSGSVITLKAFRTVSLPLFSQWHLPILLTCQRNSSWRKMWQSDRLQDRTHPWKKVDCSCALPLSEPLALPFDIFFLFIQKPCCLQTLSSNQYIFFEINTRHFVISIIQENTRTTLWWGNQM